MAACNLLFSFVLHLLQSVSQVGFGSYVTFLIILPLLFSFWSVWNIFETYILYTNTHTHHTQAQTHRQTHTHTHSHTLYNGECVHLIYNYYNYYIYIYIDRERVRQIIHMYLVTYAEESLNGKLNFLCSVNPLKHIWRLE